MELSLQHTLEQGAIPPTYKNSDKLDSNMELSLQHIICWLSLQHGAFFLQHFNSWS